MRERAWLLLESEKALGPEEARGRVRVGGGVFKPMLRSWHSI